MSGGDPWPIGSDEIEFAATIARIAARRSPWLAEEFESAAMLGLLRASRSFDPSRGAKFETFAYPCIESEVASVAGRARPAGISGARWPGVTYLSEADEDGQPWAEKLAVDELPVGWELEYEDWVRWLMSYSRRPEVMASHYLEARCETVRGMAESLGMPEWEATRIKQRTIAALRHQREEAKTGG